MHEYYVNICIGYVILPRGYTEFHEKTFLKITQSYG